MSPTFSSKKMIPDLILRKLTKKEKAAYASPYPTIASRKPLRAWPKSVPFGGNPKVTFDAITNYLEWLKETDIPKLLLHVEPGIAIIKEDVVRIKKEWKNLKTVFLGEGLHFIQEDYPDDAQSLRSGVDPR